MKALLSILLSFFLCFALKAQSLNDAIRPGHYCATEELHEFLLQSDTAYASRIKKTVALTRTRLTKAQRTESNTTIYTIPVVIHIIHDNGPENISDQQVMDGIKHLNDAYRHLPPFDGTGGADIGIQFCLASQDTLGNPTTGIVRVQSHLTNVEYENDDALFELDRWNTRKYLNIWLVKEICLREECRVNGYSSLAYEHGQPNDGVVIKALQFGRWENLSKIPIHEIGHYFNLAHTFAPNYCKNDDCTHDGDGVCDTPPDASSDEIPCGTTMNSCTADEDDHSLNNPFRPIALGGLGEQNDQTQNYMDYGNLDCINLFTEGQKTKMLSALLDVRSSLLTSAGCSMPCPFHIAIHSSAPTVDLGNTLSFENASTGGTHFRWELDDVLLSTATNVSYTFHVKGTHTWRLSVSNEDSSCVSSTLIPVRVIPVCVKPIASFYTSPANSSSIVAGSNIYFFSNSGGATHFKWKIDDVQVSNNVFLKYTFPSPGVHKIKLLAINFDIDCVDSTEMEVTVIPPCPTSFTASSITAAPGNTIFFTNTSSHLSHFIWQINGTEFSTQRDAGYTFNERGNYTIKLLGYNDDSTCASSDSASLSIRICPDVFASFDVPPFIYSQGYTFHFPNTSTGSDSFIWKIDGIEYSNSKDLEYNFPLSGNHTLTLIAYNQDSTCTDSVSTTISVRPICLVMLHTDPQTTTMGSSIYLLKTSIGPTHFIWKMNGVVFESADHSFLYTFNQPGNYDIQLIGYNDDLSCKDSMSVTVSISARPICTVSFIATPLTVTMGGSIYLQNTSIGSTDFIWKMNGVVFEPPNGTPYTFSLPGNYNIQLMGYSEDLSCKDSMSVTVIVTDTTAGVHPATNTVIPNLITANGDGLNDTFEVTGLSDGYTLEVYNQWDAVVYKKENYDNSFAADGLNSNIYFYNLYHPETGQSYRGWLHVIK